MLIQLLWSLAGSVVPNTFDARGAGGGGALFAPSFSPLDAKDLSVACDMSELFHTNNLGQTWRLVDFRSIQANRVSTVRHSGSVRFVVDVTDASGADLHRLMHSTDGGINWLPLASDPTGGEAYDIMVHPNDPQRLLVFSYGEVWVSKNGGATWTSRLTALDGGAGIRLAGAFYDGANAWLGTNDGLFASSDSGWTWSPVALPGLGTTQRLVSLSGGKSAGQVQILAATADVGDVFAGVNVEDFNGSAQTGLWIWRPGQSAWAVSASGIDAGHRVYQVAQSTGSIDTLYAGGGRWGEDWPVIYRTTNAGQTWSEVLLTTSNANAATGWAGVGGDRDWSYGGMVCGLAVAPGDGKTIAYTDYGFVHVSSNAGTSWRQAYVNPQDQNPSGSPTPKGKSYRSAGIENTTAWNLLWADSTTVVASFSDIRGVRSTNAGVSWGFDYSGHNLNSMYHAVQAPDGRLYAATSSVHDIYQSTYLADARIDGGSGVVLTSSDKGKTWTTLWNAGHPVVWLALDPKDPKVLYASVVHSTAGGIYKTANLDKGVAASWQKLTSPPRTQGHPLVVQVLADGSLLSSWSGRRDPAGAFTASSGVFRLPAAGTWQDLSHTGMHYWTKDVVVDPADPSQKTWWVAVFSGWGGAPNGLGGLYRTTDAGANWTRVWDEDRVESVAFPPDDPTEMYATTEIHGLWRSTNRTAPSPTMAEVVAYLFRQPTRVFFNPRDPLEMWVTSFGNSLRVGRREAGVAIAPHQTRGALQAYRTQAGIVVEGLTPGVLAKIRLYTPQGTRISSGTFLVSGSGRLLLPTNHRGPILVQTERTVRLVGIP